MRNNAINKRALLSRALPYENRAGNFVNGELITDLISYACFLARDRRVPRTSCVSFFPALVGVIEHDFFMLPIHMLQKYYYTVLSN